MTKNNRSCARPLEAARPNLNRQDNAQSVHVESCRSERIRKARIAITDDAVARLPVSDFGIAYCWDTDLNGFGVRVYYKGTRA